MKDNKKLFKEIVEKIEQNYDRESNDFISIAFAQHKIKEGLSGIEINSFYTDFINNTERSMLLASIIKSFFPNKKLKEDELMDLLAEVLFIYLNDGGIACQELKKS